MLCISFHSDCILLSAVVLRVVRLSTVNPPLLLSTDKSLLWLPINRQLVYGPKLPLLYRHMRCIHVMERDLMISITE